MELDAKIEKITIDTIKMFDLTLEYLESAVDIYLNNSLITLPKINDDSIDHLERSIEEECLRLILKERPFAKDLRKVTGVFKLVEDIERLGDHSEDILWTATNLLKYSSNLTLPTIKEEIKVAMSMVKDSYNAFAKGDVALAKNICNRDDIVDNLYIKSLKEIPEFKDKYNLGDEFILYSTLLVKYVERLADHASNIAEWVNYIEDGYYKDGVII